ncbi:tetratricopeptide repeat protein [Catalinimonas alkaloidigena]|nr:tetratricopeptide repeat protein [Catalinimonas alkaloidigena]
MEASSSEVKQLVEQAYQYNIFDADQLTQYLALLQQAKAYFGQQESEKERLECLLAEVFGIYMNGQQREALQQLEDCLPQVRALGDPGQLVFAKGVAGLITWTLGDLTRGMRELLEALAILEETQVTEDWLSTYYLLGNQYLDLKDLENARRCFEKGLALPEHYTNRVSVPITQARIYDGLASVCLLEVNYGQALTYLAKARHLQERCQDNYGLSRTLHDTAFIYRKKGLVAQALDYYGQSLALRRKASLKNGLVTTLTHLGEFHLELGKPDLAFPLLEEGLQWARQVGVQSKVCTLYHLLSRYYKLAGDAPRALECLEEYLALRDHMASDEVQMQLKRLSIRHELEKSEREAEIHRLRHTELKAAYDEISQINEHLKEVISYVEERNQQISAHKEEIEAQSEQLRCANEAITELNQQLEDKVRERTASLAQQNQLFKEYAELNAHKVRGPLARILGLLQLVRIELVKPEELPTILGHLEHSAQELDQVVTLMNEVLSKSR